ncbi:MAG TPA: RpiB/LacA/LacB family sugar-phosphate isomerase [Humisphaera sp.]|jgi:ribose 5-phosphate isomerase RpiB|nr:RpiB/LacA/LacB family sugar-phosphate isomerase [Humisphaera sp.]
MIITARQLEDLHRQNGGNGHLTLPYRARLTPLASDWVRSRKIVLGYSSVASPAASDAPAEGLPLAASPFAAAATSPSSQSSILYWCDGPCGPAKAAVVAHEKQSNLRQLDKPADAREVVAVIKAIAIEIKSQRAQAAILLVQHGATAMVFANRCPSLRAVLGTCLESVDQGVQQMAANVLVIEHPYKTLQQVKNMIGRFVRGPRKLSDEVQRQLQELTSCA